MRTIWFRDAKTDEQKAERKLQILAAQAAFEVLIKHLDSKVDEAQTQRDSEGAFSTKDYGAYQAYMSGYIKALKEVKSLINLKE